MYFLGYATRMCSASSTEFSAIFQHPDLSRCVTIELQEMEYQVNLPTYFPWIIDINKFSLNLVVNFEQNIKNKKKKQGYFSNYKVTKCFLFLCLFQVVDPRTDQLTILYKVNEIVSSILNNLYGGDVKLSLLYTLKLKERNSQKDDELFIENMGKVIYVLYLGRTIARGRGQ